MNSLWLFILPLAVSIQASRRDFVLEKLFLSLHQVFQFALARDINDLNFLLGVAVARGQLIVSRRYLRRFSKKRVIVDRLEILAGRLLEGLPNRQVARSASAELWSVDFPIHYLDRHATTANLEIPNATESGDLKALIHGHPTPQESNHCIAHVVANCTTPKDCMDVETTENSSGYALTHQIIYFQIARGMGCNQKNMNYSKKIKQKCERVSLENSKMLSLGLPSYYQDLYAEQVVVCGLEGIKDFLTPFNLRTILSLQKAPGCFGEVDFGKKGEYLEGCSLHLTGVATAAVGIFIKSIVSWKL